MMNDCYHHCKKRKLFRWIVLFVLLHAGCGFHLCSNDGIKRWSCASTSFALQLSDVDEDYYLRLLEEDEKEEAEEMESSVTSLEAIKAYHEKRRQRREWGLQLEEWKRLGIQARKDRRHDLQQQQRGVKAHAMAKEYLTNRLAGSNHDIQSVQLDMATAIFTRLLNHLELMEQQAYERGKQRAIQREMEIVTGKSTVDNTASYSEKIEEVREMEQAQRRKVQECVFELPNNWKTTFNDDELLTILKIRGNVKNAGKLQKRETIHRCVQESFAKPLF